MRRIHDRVRGLRAMLALAALITAGLVVAGCGSSSSSTTSSSGGSASATASASSSTTTASNASGGSSSSTSSCGPKPGVKATGSPINVGTIDTKQPGTDFSDGRRPSS